MTLHFSDGVSIDTSGPLRVLELEDGFYVVGKGMLIPVNSQTEALSRISMMQERINTSKKSHDYIDFEEVR